MAFLGKKVITPKGEIRAEKALILLVKTSSIEDLIPVDQTVKSMAIPRAEILFFGLGEYDTVKAPSENNESITDHDGNDQVLDKKLTGELTVLGNFEYNDVDDIEAETWSIFVADPKTVYRMAGYDGNQVSMAAVTVAETFLAHRIYHQIKLTGNATDEFGQAQRVPFTFTKELESNSDGKYQKITVTLS